MCEAFFFFKLFCQGVDGIGQEEGIVDLAW